MMAQLHQDHLNLSRLLGVLKHKLALLKGGERPNYLLVQDVVAYIVDYADTYHHPLEDVIYQYSAEHYPEYQEIFNEVEQEHQKIAQDTRAFQELVQNILLDAIVPMAQFIERLEQFVNQQYAHLNREEGRVFPLLERTISTAQWQEIEQRLQSREDPLFGENVADEYKRLYRELISESEII
ncbi:hypothetical protein BTE48_00885 [Oceanospirillum multiglobuliferum]|uniref:Hemerythrin-like domain-containing protein n=1 Tax=Oceanospirillum multiglobuliferum TaxID=64969 RepID=A0A1V4T984_9GAMM|nr:hypothetical protein BTE48_00885 [Oceanospirillum multiglobuliferum]